MGGGKLLTQDIHQPVGSHIFFVAFVLSAYLGWAAFGKLFTGEYPFFWMDREEVEKTEYIASYVSGFVSLGLTGEDSFVSFRLAVIFFADNNCHSLRLHLRPHRHAREPL